MESSPRPLTPSTPVASTLRLARAFVDGQASGLHFHASDGAISTDICDTIDAQNHMQTREKANAKIYQTFTSSTIVAQNTSKGTHATSCSAVSLKKPTRPQTPLTRTGITDYMPWKTQELKTLRTEHRPRMAIQRIIVRAGIKPASAPASAPAAAAAAAAASTTPITPPTPPRPTTPARPSTSTTTKTKTHISKQIEWCEAALEMSKQPENDSSTIKMLPDIVEALAEHTRSAHELECLLGVMHNLSMDGRHQEQLCCSNVINVLLPLINTACIEHDIKLSSSLDREKFIVAALASVRNLCSFPFVEDTQGIMLLQKFVIPLCDILDSFIAQPSVLLAAIRALSKLTAFASCRQTIVEHKTAIVNLLQILLIHQTKLSLCVRVAFIMGNLTMTSDKTREIFYKSNVTALEKSSMISGMDVIFESLERTAMRHIKLQKLVAHSESKSAKYQQMLKESDDLLIKLIRLIANISINRSLGPSILHNPRTRWLMVLLSQANTDECEELDLNLVSALASLSYYDDSVDSETPVVSIFFMPISDVVAHLMPHLFSSNSEMVTECLRCFGNLSRTRNLRELIRSSRIDEALLLLLDHSVRQVVHGACGVLLNLALDGINVSILLKNDSEGMWKLLDIFERFLLHEEPAFDVIGMICKLLLNFRTANGCLPSQITVNFKAQLLDLLKQTIAFLLDDDGMITENSADGQLLEICNSLVRSITNDAADITTIASKKH